MNDRQFRIAIQQRVLPAYRVPFFDMLADTFHGNVSVFYGLPRSHEMLNTNLVPSCARSFRGRNLHLFSSRLYLCWQAGLMRWLRDWEPQVLVMEANPRYPHSIHAIRWMKRNDRKVIGWGLGSPYPQGVLAGLRIHQRRSFILNFDALITYSQQGAEQYAKLGFPEERIFIAPNAVAGKPTLAPPQRPLRYAFNQPQVLFVGRLQERKKVDLLIKASALIPDDLKPQLHIVGDGPARNDLLQLAEATYPAVKFYGAVHGSDLAALFQKADLFVLPGTGGLAVQEAMSFALPVIVGEADGTQSDLVRPGNGWVLKNSTAEELAGIMTDALKDIPQLRKMGAASFDIVKSEVNLENMVAAFKGAIDAVRKENQ
jgi:glycosyltransferase involved in cell wall biosynthesis